jgi:hypothetical protein
MWPGRDAANLTAYTQRCSSHAPRSGVWKPKTKRRLDDSLHEARAIAATQATASSMSFRICWINRSLPAFRSRTHICMARTYLVFGDIDGKLDVLRVVRALSTEGPLSRPQTATLTLRWPAASFALLTLLREPLLSGKFVNPVHIPFHKDVQELPCALVRDVAVVGDQTVSVSDIDFRLSHTWNVEIAQH